MTDERRLFEALCTKHWLAAGFRRVKQNKGSPGVDGVTIQEFERRLDGELSRLKEELQSWTYQPSPVRRVEIPKAGGKGIRLLGVPTVRDRVVHATVKLLLEPIFEPLFSENSYGFRPGRNQRQAVEAAREIVAGGKPYVVDIDLSKFFDRIGHDRLIARLGRTIPDKRILRLIGQILRSGILANGLLSPSREGAVQGSPLSPLLSNIVLDELDKELERRGVVSHIIRMGQYRNHPVRIGFERWLECGTLMVRHPGFGHNSWRTNSTEGYRGQGGVLSAAQEAP